MTALDYIQYLILCLGFFSGAGALLFIGLGLAAYIDHLRG